MTFHPQFELDGVLVDANIAPLLKKLWRLGFTTYLSCQDNVPEGYAWIEFSSREEGVDFVAILSDVLPSVLNYDHDYDVRMRFLGRKYRTCSVRFPNRFLNKITRFLKGITDEPETFGDTTPPVKFERVLSCQDNRN